MATYGEGDAERTIALRPVAGSEWEPDDGKTAKRFDIGASTIYVGEAAAGASTASAAWTIKKFTLDGSGNPTAMTMTAIRGGVWNNRATETYT